MAYHIPPSTTQCLRGVFGTVTGGGLVPTAGPGSQVQAPWLSPYEDLPNWYRLGNKRVARDLHALYLTGIAPVPAADLEHRLT